MGGCISRPRDCCLDRVPHAAVQHMLQFLSTPERLELARTSKRMMRESVVLFLWQRPPDPLIRASDLLRLSVNSVGGGGGGGGGASAAAQIPNRRRRLNMLELMDNQLRRAEMESQDPAADDRMHDAHPEARNVAILPPL